MKKLRIIPRLDVKGPNVVKGLQLEGLRIIGKPAELAKKYYEQGADEILYIDIVASLYERNNLLNVVEETVSKGIFVPITVGGGIRTLEDIKKILRAGADKVAINTAATRKPEFIIQAARMFGSQCIVGSVEAKYKGDSKWEAYIDNGREKTGLDAVEWAKKLVELGAGELLITSIDREGMRNGLDKELVKRITAEVSVPVIACGGAKDKEDIYSCFSETGCDGVAFATLLHYNNTTIIDVKEFLAKKQLPIRTDFQFSGITCQQEKSREKKEAKKKTISIIDYDVGNMKSIISAFKILGNPVKMISSAKDILTAELLVLPGDGAFGFAMADLRKKNMIEPIKKYAKSGKPLLGICLGMQLLMDESQEFGNHQGLGLIPGKVIPLKPKKDIKAKGKNENYNVPHMGWNSLKKPKGATWENTILRDIKNGSEAYFVHSYYVAPENKKHVLATTTYGGQEFCTVLRKDNIIGTQFHPEKSGEIGMSIIKSFSEM